MPEVMQCVICGKKEVRRKGSEARWKIFNLSTGSRYYVCPDEFPPGDAGYCRVRRAYLRVLLRIAEIEGCLEIH